MSSQQYCYDQVAKPGSDIYYSTRFIEPAQRDALIPLYAFVHALEQVLYECSEPQVAQQKFSWWLQELAAAYQEKAQHPIGQALQPIIKQYQIPQRLLVQIATGISKRLQHAHYQKFTEVVEQHYRAISSWPLLVATVTGYTDKATIQYTHDLGISLQLIDIIQHLRRDLSKGYLYLAENDLKHYQINEAKLLQYQHSQQLTELLSHYAAKARDYHQQALTHLQQQSNQLASLTLAKLKLKLLDEIEKANFPILTHRTELTPLRKLWIAWRTFRTTL